MTNSHKKFRLQADEIKPIATGFGACLATDMITVSGMKVGFMERLKPRNEYDSGWNFLAGVENQEYLDNPANLEQYDVNTIANYDPEVIPFLEAPVGSTFQRDRISGKFIAVPGGPID